MGDQLQALDQVRSTAIDLGMKFGPKLVVAILILFAGVVVGRWAGRATLRVLARLNLDPPVQSLLERGVRLLVLALFAIMALQNLGVELLPLIAGLGVAGAGIALAMQGVLGNLVAGLTIIFTRPFRVGDYVSIVKEEGEVLDVSLFNTTLGHPDRSKVVIPNRRIVGEIMHNYGKIRQLDVEVSIAMDANLAAAQSRHPGGAAGQCAGAEGSGARRAGEPARRRPRGDFRRPLGERAGLPRGDQRNQPVDPGSVPPRRHSGAGAAARSADARGPRLSAGVPGPLVPAALAFAADGTPYSAAFGDVYHSAEGGPAQARHVFLHGNGLPGRWQGRRAFTILETGFGFGLSFLATWQAWREDPQRCGRLHFVSVEKHPFAASDLAFCARNIPNWKSKPANCSHAWPMLVPGMHRMEFEGGNVVLTLFFGDIAEGLPQLQLAADAFYLDGFAPAKNPQMWEPRLLRHLGRLAAPGATLATWSVAAPVREALEGAGFAVEKRQGFGTKREMLAGRLIRRTKEFQEYENKRSNSHWRRHRRRGGGRAPRVARLAGDAHRAPCRTRRGGLGQSGRRVPSGRCARRQPVRALDARRVPDPAEPLAEAGRAWPGRAAACCRWRATTRNWPRSGARSRRSATRRATRSSTQRGAASGFLRPAGSARGRSSRACFRVSRSRDVLTRRFFPSPGKKASGRQRTGRTASSPPRRSSCSPTRRTRCGSRRNRPCACARCAAS